LLHLFGDEGLASLRAGDWKFILVIAPVFGFIADVCTVFGRSAPTLLVVCALIGGVLALPIVFRTKYCQHCAIPCVFAIILVIAFGFVAATQRVFAAEDTGVAAKFIPGIPEIQNTLGEILGIQKTTLTTVTGIKSDTTDIKQQLAEAKTELAKVQAQLDTNNALVKQLVDKLSQTNPAAAAAPETKERLTQAVTSIEQGAATDPRYARALDLLKAGKPAEAEPLLLAVAEDFAKRGDTKSAAAAYRNLASIAAVSDPGRARDYYARAAQLDPSDVDGMFQNGWFQKEAGHLEAAQAAYAHVIAMAKPGVDDENLVWAKFGTGDIERQRGDLGGALATYHEAETTVERLAKSDPDNTSWQRDLSVSYEKVGDVQVAQGTLPAALASYQASLTIRDRLAKSDPGDAGRQFDLGISDERIGDVQMEQGDLAGALKSYEAKRDVIARLAKSNPDNTSWQRDLSISYEKIGDVQAKQSNLPAALTSYQKDFAITERLAKSDPGNAVWQRDLSVVYNKVGDIHVAQGDLPTALTSYQASLTIRARLTKSDPGDADWQRDMAMSYARLSYIYLKSKQVPQAQEALAAGRAIIAPLTAQHPEVAQWKQDLAWFDQNIAALKN
jgi:tetratricopeptide (TPR) repeat protein